MPEPADQLHLVGAVVFCWEREKARTNLVKHGVSFEEAATAFEDEAALVIPDPDHSEDENRLIVLGYSARLRLLMVVHVERGSEVRIISARRVTRQERMDYES